MALYDRDAFEGSLGVTKLNASMESFFGTLKIECLHHYKFKTRDEAKRVTFKYIEVFYNRIRRYAELKNQISAEFAKTYMQNTEKNAA